MLVVQAQFEDLTLVTVDPKISAYNVHTIDAST
jgi:PIN domain nuclease of toxin-antitoxin system